MEKKYTTMNGFLECLRKMKISFKMPNYYEIITRFESEKMVIQSSLIK